MRATLVLLWLSLSGCFAAHETPPELLQCPESPYVGSRSLWRSESPARGRIWACEACALHEEEVLSRAVALGCPLRSAHDACAVTGACDYPSSVAWLAEIRHADSCEALTALADTDGCVRPDPDVYWRPEGD